MLSEQDGKLLLELARNSIVSCFSKDKLDTQKYQQFNKKQGVFVTLHKQGELRGCIGFPYAAHPLFEATLEAAQAAAFDDPRFPQLDEDELKEIDIEISVLTVPTELEGKPDTYPSQIKIGEDGLILKSPLTSGLLLPQVFTEYDCTPERALEMVCEKAGLPIKAWSDSTCTVMKFQAQIFKEQDD